MMGSGVGAWEVCALEDKETVMQRKEIAAKNRDEKTVVKANFSVRRGCIVAMLRDFYDSVIRCV
jgi:hypothetical protein